MSLFDAPKPPDATAVSNAQQGYNVNAGTAQQHENMVNQSNPYGSMNYAQTGTNPDGTPIFSQTTTLSPEQQGLLNAQNATKSTLGGAASTLAGNVADMYSHAPNLDVKTLTNQVMNQGHDYLQPIFDTQQGTLEAKLRNQGIAPGSEAWTNANRDQSRNVNDAYTKLLMQAEPEAYRQAVSTYQLPGQTLASLMGASAPTNPSWNATPTANIQPPNYAGVVEQNYQQQSANHNAMLNGLFGAAGAIGGGWAKGGFGMPGGGSTGAEIAAIPEMAAMFSDRRVKHAIRHIGRLANGLPLYVFKYNGSDEPHLGLMADEVEKIHPAAVHDFGGVKLVDYAQAVM